MKKKLIFAVFVAFLLSLAPAYAQQSLFQSFTENIAQAPAAVLVGQNYSTTTNTGASTSLTGGAVAAGSYRIGVTCFSSSNTETPLSTDTAATAVVTTTGATSTVTVYPPLCVGTGNEVGYRVYIGGNGGGSGAETLQTLNATVCTLSSSATASCSLQSPAVFTASTNFTGGGGGPASPGTLIYPPTANAANQSLFENSLYPTQVISWTNVGSNPGACAFQIQTGATIAALANVGQSITCTTSGSYALPSAALANFVSVNVTSYTAGSTTSSTIFTMTAQPYTLGAYWGNAAPTSACTAQTGLYVSNGTTTSALYYCSAGTWTLVTLP